MITELNLGADNSGTFFIQNMTGKLMMGRFNDLFGEEFYKTYKAQIVYSDVLYEMLDYIYCRTASKETCKHNHLDLF